MAAPPSLAGVTRASGLSRFSRPRRPAACPGLLIKRRSGWPRRQSCDGQSLIRTPADPVMGGNAVRLPEEPRLRRTEPLKFVLPATAPATSSCWYRARWER